MMWASSALPRNGRLLAVGSGRGNVGCPMLWQRQPPQIALVSCYVDLPPSMNLIEPSRWGVAHDVGNKRVAPEWASSGRGRR